MTRIKRDHYFVDLVQFLDEKEKQAFCDANIHQFANKTNKFFEIILVWNGTILCLKRYILGGACYKKVTCVKIFHYESGSEILDYFLTFYIFLPNIQQY